MFIGHAAVEAAVRLAREPSFFMRRKWYCLEIKSAKRNLKRFSVRDSKHGARRHRLLAFSTPTPKIIGNGYLRKTTVDTRMMGHYSLTHLCTLTDGEWSDGTWSSLCRSTAPLHVDYCYNGLSPPRSAPRSESIGDHFFAKVRPWNVKDGTPQRRDSFGV